MLVSNQRHNPSPQPITVHQTEIDRVSSYRYLGTHLTPKLSFALNTAETIAKTNKRLFIMKRTNYIDASQKTLHLAYTAFIESVISFHLPVIYGHMSAKDKSDLSRVVKNANKLSGRQHFPARALVAIRVLFGLECLVTHPHGGFWWIGVAERSWCVRAAFTLVPLLVVITTCRWPRSVAAMEDSGRPGDKFVFIVEYRHDRLRR